MADSIRLGILDDALAKLQAARPTGAPEPAIGRGSEPQAPAVTLYWLEDRMQRAGGRALSETDWLGALTAAGSPVQAHALLLEVEVRVAVAAGSNAYRAADELCQWVTTALDGQVLAGAMRECVEVRALAGVAGGDREFLIVTMHFAVLYQTRAGAPALTA